MLILLDQKADENVLQQVAQDLDGYIKFVVDIERELMTAGGLRHYEGEQLLLTQGSKQENLWGGGLDLQTKELDFDSMINIRPAQNNPSREVLDINIRNKMESVVNKLLIDL